MTPPVPRRQLAVALAPRDTAAARQQLHRAARVADLAELRLDLMDSFDLPALLANRPCPVIVTYRPLREGGRYVGDEAARLRVLHRAAELGADYLDVEHDALDRFGDRGAARVIVSRHDFSSMPDLADWWARQRDQRADVVKVVGTARDPRDNLRALDLLARADVPTIALCMGPLGLPSRVLGLRADSCFLTFAALDDSGGTASGQVSARAMRQRYRVQSLGPQTHAFGVLTDRDGSAEASALNAQIEALDRNAVCVPWVASTDPHVLLQAAQHLVQGFAVAPAWQHVAFAAAATHDEPSLQAGRCDALLRVAGGGYAGRLLGSLEETAAWWDTSIENR